MTRCAQARRWIAADGAGTLPPRTTIELASHASSCKACAARLRGARLLTSDLTRLRAGAPPDPHVAARVLARIATTPAPSRREEVGRRELAWIAAGIAAVTLAGLATAVAQAPLLLDLLERSGAAATRMRTVFVALASPARALFETVGGAMLATCAAISAAAGRSLGGAPSISSLAWIALLLVVGTTVLVIRRDLRRAAGASHSDKES